MLVFPARAKINLCLEVGGLRKDGYHDIWSILHSIELSDVMRLEMKPGIGSFTLKTHSKLPKDNSVSNAYRAFAKYYPQYTEETKYTLYIEKGIPFCAGLGGSSASAGALLAKFGEIYDIPRHEMLSVAADVSSDTPFCVLGGCVLAQGRGERLTTLRKFTPKTFALIVKPKVGLSTKQLFQSYDEQYKNNTESDDERKERHEKLKKAVSGDRIDYDTFKVYGKNDLESAAIQRCEDIGRIKSELYDHGALYALMTGSGSAVYGIFDDLRMMCDAEERLTNKSRYTYKTWLANADDKGFFKY